MSILAAISCLAILFQISKPNKPTFALGNSVTYLPFIMQGRTASNTPTIHLPFVDDDSVFNILTRRYSELGIFWFGKVNNLDNYSDVRVGYNRYVLIMDIGSIDRQLWYDDNASDFRDWDSVSVFLSIIGTNGQPNRQIRLDTQVSHVWDSDLRDPYELAFQKLGTQWSPINFPFRTEIVTRGEDLNGPGIEEGWHVTYRIPFSSLGISNPPSTGSTIQIGIKTYDRDSATGQTLVKSWPTDLQEMDDFTYGSFTFGYPSLQNPSSPPMGTVSIRQSSTDMVHDSTVGGHTTCGYDGDNKWNEWGDRVFNQAPENVVAVVQNQKDISDWPCFSRYYITFPLNRVPQGKVILSAKLTLKHFGGSDPENAEPSYIQIMRVNEPWDPNSITWNNAPQVIENYPGIWVSPVEVANGGSDPARTWDVTKALVDVYGTGEPLRLALYSADSAMHSGKYFRSSETASWGSEYPPTLTIEWGNP